MKLFGNPEQLPKMVTCKEFLQAEICTVFASRKPTEVRQFHFILYLCIEKTDRY